MRPVRLLTTTKSFKIKDYEYKCEKVEADPKSEEVEQLDNQEEASQREEKSKEEEKVGKEVVEQEVDEGVEDEVRQVERKEPVMSNVHIPKEENKRVDTPGEKIDANGKIRSKVFSNTNFSP